MINEMRKIRLLEEKRGVRIPTPNFFYVERFGRSAREQMEGLLLEINKKEWFLFKTDGRFREEGLLHSFMMEIEKYAKLGKAYNECVLIELSEKMYWEDDFEEFLAYIKSLEDRIYFVFTMKQAKSTALIQKCIERYFFIRIIEAEEYMLEEQMEEITSICKEYSYKMSEEAEAYIRLELEKKEWKDEEQVLCRLKNMVCNAVYEQALEKESEGEMQEEYTNTPALCTLTLDMAKNMMSKMETDNKKRAIIGFNQGGLQYE